MNQQDYEIGYRAGRMDAKLEELEKKLDRMLHTSFESLERSQAILDSIQVMASNDPLQVAFEARARARSLCRCTACELKRSNAIEATQEVQA